MGAVSTVALLLALYSYNLYFWELRDPETCRLWAFSIKLRRSALIWAYI
jgi:hypothetical protein